MKKQRIDILLANSGLVESRNKAQRLVMAGEVKVDGQLVHKSSELFDPSCHIEIKSKPKYVSRGGLKLEKAITEFKINDISGRICADIGASTGGFTDCLLQNGAEKIYAVDVGYGQLHQSLRKNPRVIEMERVNVKDVKGFPEPIELVTIDVSFISLKIVVPSAIKFIKSNSKIVALIKPQFEIGKGKVGKGGIIKDPSAHDEIISGLKLFFREIGLCAINTIESPILGAKGNREFFIALKQAEI